MARVEDVLDRAYADLGYYAPDDPEPGSAAGRWMAEVTGEDWLRGPSWDIWWCCCWVSMVMGDCAQEVPGLPTYNTDVFLAGNRERVSLNAAKPGDIVVFDWDGNGATDHIGIVYAWNGETLTLIEGNYRNSVALVDRTDCIGCIAAIVPVHYDGVDDLTPYDASGVYVLEMARRVIDGAYGNGEERKYRIYDAVQRTVNDVLKGREVSDAVLLAFARDVIDGAYGNGEERVENVYSVVQDRVNELML